MIRGPADLYVCKSFLACGFKVLFAETDKP